MSSNCQTTIHCKIQNRLGALDRVLGAFTQRGIIPSRLESRIDSLNILQISVDFRSDNSRELEKLVKVLQKQVYVIDAWAIETQSESTKITELFTSTDGAKRRVSNVHNA